MGVRVNFWTHFGIELIIHHNWKWIIFSAPLPPGIGQTPFALWGENTSWEPAYSDGCCMGIAVVRIDFDFRFLQSLSTYTEMTVCDYMSNKKYQRYHAKLSTRQLWRECMFSTQKTVEKMFNDEMPPSGYGSWLLILWHKYLTFPTCWCLLLPRSSRSCWLSVVNSRLWKKGIQLLTITFF